MFNVTTDKKLNRILIFGWSNNTGAQVVALKSANSGSILGTTYSPLNTAENYS